MLIGEVWSQALKEIQMENLKPISSNLKAKETISKGNIEKTYCWKKKKSRDILNEQRLYADVNMSHRLREAAVTEFIDKVARTFIFTILHAAKNKHMLSIDIYKIRPKNRDMDPWHGIDQL